MAVVSLSLYCQITVQHSTPWAIRSCCSAAQPLWYQRHRNILVPVLPYMSRLSHSSMLAVPQTVFPSHAAYLRGPFLTSWFVSLPTPRTSQPCPKNIASTLTSMLMTRNSTTAAHLPTPSLFQIIWPAAPLTLPDGSPRVIKPRKDRNYRFGSHFTLAKLQRVDIGRSKS